MIVSFPGNQFKGEIAPALAELVESNTIRIIDLAFVGKNEDGEVVAFELTELDADVRRGLDALGDRGQRTLQRGRPDGRGRGARAEHVGGAAGLGERLGGEARKRDARRRRRARRVRAAPARCRQGGARVGSPPPRTQREEVCDDRRRGGLVRVAATTAVVAGTAGAVSHHQQQKYAAQDQAAAATQ